MNAYEKAEHRYPAKTYAQETYALRGAFQEGLEEGLAEVRAQVAEVARLRKGLADLRKGICEWSPDTVWVSDIETAAEFITGILNDGWTEGML